VLVIGGSRGLTGAVCMASSAAIRVGAGYATVAVPADLEDIFEIKLTEVMSRGLEGTPGRLGSGSADAILEAA
jgi:NAD(P)H-hydrate epimerase